jgi:hypothetical protein
VRIEAGKGVEGGYSRHREQYVLFDQTSIEEGNLVPSSAKRDVGLAITFQQ